jgi:hypothetical protein
MVNVSNITWWMYSLKNYNEFFYLKVSYILKNFGSIKWMCDVLSLVPPKDTFS